MSDADHAHRDEQDADDEAGARGGDLRAAPILAYRPDDRGEDAAAVERGARQQVEHAEHEIDETDVERNRRQKTAVAERRRESERGSDEGDAEADARRGSGDRDEKLAARVLGFVLEAGDAAEQPQGDAFDALAAALRDERVRELVGEDRGEEHGGGEDRGRPVGAAGVGFEVGEHARGEGVREQASDEEQAPVDTDLDAADAAEADGRGQRGSFPVLPYNGATFALVPSRFRSAQSPRPRSRRSRRHTR